MIPTQDSSPLSTENLKTQDDSFTSSSKKIQSKQKINHPIEKGKKKKDEKKEEKEKLVKKRDQKVETKEKVCKKRGRKYKFQRADDFKEYQPHYKKFFKLFRDEVGYADLNEFSIDHLQEASQIKSFKELCLTPNQSCLKRNHQDHPALLIVNPCYHYSFEAKIRLCEDQGAKWWLKQLQDSLRVSIQCDRNYQNSCPQDILRVLEEVLEMVK